MIKCTTKNRIIIKCTTQFKYASSVGHARFPVYFLSNRMFFGIGMGLEWDWNGIGMGLERDCNGIGMDFEWD